MVVLNQRNLPPKSVAWARTLENSHAASERKISQAKLLASGGNKALAGQFGVASRNLDRLQLNADALQANVVGLQEAVTETGHRSTAVLNYGTQSVGRTTAVLNQQYSFSTTGATQTFNSPDGNVRNGVIFVTARAYNTHPTITFGSVFLSATLGGTNSNLASPRLDNPGVASVPPGWTDSVFLTGGFRSAALTVQLRAQGFLTRTSGSATTVNVGVQNVQIVVIWGDK